MLSFKNLSIGHHNVVLESIEGTLETNKITFLIGPNGSGKTSLLKTLAQIIPPLKGVISTEEHPIYLTSDHQFQSGLTGKDLFDLYGSKASKWYDEEVLELFEIKDLLSYPLDTLSSGERQRILICAVLFHKSSLLLLDEPLNHLDWNFALKLKKIIQKYTKSGRSFLISNHDLNWSLNFEDTQTWVLFQKSIFLKNSTESVLSDVRLQKVFKIKTEIVSSPSKKIISLSELED